MYVDAKSRRMFSKATPAATDFQHAVAGTQSQHVDDALILARLCSVQWLRVITIAGRHYITREAIFDFNRRAAAGEFAGTVANPRGHSAKKEGGAE